MARRASPGGAPWDATRMIQPQTILNVADNSGAKTVKCIKIGLGLDGSSKKARYASVGDCILVSVTSVRPGLDPSARRGGSQARTVQKGQIYKALVIRTRKGISSRMYGHSLAFDSNDVVLLQADSNAGQSATPIGSRIFGPVTRELRAQGAAPMGAAKKILAQAKKIL